jgi:hypothetical protein
VLDSKGQAVERLPGGMQARGRSTNRGEGEGLQTGIERRIPFPEATYTARGM